MIELPSSRLRLLPSEARNVAKDARIAELEQRVTAKIVTGEKMAVSHVVKLTTPDEWEAVKSYFEEAYRVSLEGSRGTKEPGAV